MELALETLTVRHDGALALGPLSLALPPGTQLLVHGPSGGGKTTLLKALAGLVRPTSGRVTWNGDDAWALDAVGRRAAQAGVGFVFQSDALFDSLTVEENVRLPLERRGVPLAEAKARAMEALGRVGLVASASKRPEALSGGMRKRTGLARAIVTRPQVLLADDPFAGLDPDTEGEMAALLLEVARERTLVVATPDPVEALPLTRRRLVAGALE